MQTLSHAAGVLVASTALSPIGTDAELIATCATFCDLERAYDAPGFRHETGTPEGDAAAQEREHIVAEQDVLVERMCKLPCTTLAGVQAMARALATWDRELLKDGPAHDVGEIIVSNMVERLLALRPQDPHPDADLLAVCAEFRASEAAYSAIYDDDPEATDEACAVLANPIAQSWDGMLDRMAQLRATTVEGLAARAMALAQHSGIKPGTENYPFAFEPDRPDDVTGRLLHMLLTDALKLRGALQPDPDAALLSLRDEFRAAVAQTIQINRTDDVPDEDMDSSANRLCQACKAIVESPPAQTRAGRALKAAAAMHKLTAAFNADCDDDWPGIGEELAWHVLSEIAGDEYVPTLPDQWEPPRRALEPASGSAGT